MTLEENLLKLDLKKIQEFLELRRHSHDCDQHSCCYGKCVCGCGWQSAQDMLDLCKQLVGESQ